MDSKQTEFLFSCVMFMPISIVLLYHMFDQLGSVWYNFVRLVGVTTKRVVEKSKDLMLERGEEHIPLHLVEGGVSCARF
ncbi:MAG TPA: hypothetical protein DE117_07515 [Fervidobacterium sp.]|nr:hypothetical protein [Fervidobacterium sp.]